ncbi:hypothetical protein DICSQDRAFT_57684 [Dichomitus squalens LYAD-421 SS1]|uniref:uncharacterized protein n=1 Tax=Dichomitus squalens (strain LYAD-421) TaxID=732165 RepID=UPI00044116A2|nr:uncharacterized protein DICSQDRAFT_57684 [Dichomitus squalens LYAD-421 SS1]EJF62607.1 hypothetical protein DICSQDRAFT_57684 [Dichomitus squalens LYAD-421 SS1]
MLTLQVASIFSTTVEATLYGYSVFMFMLAMWIMLRDRRRRHINHWMVAAGCGLIALATAEMAVNIARVYQGFVSKGPFTDGGPEAYFANVSELTFVVKSCLYNAQTLILDAVVIYRTYVVWQNILVCVVPMIGWCGLFAGSIGLNVALATAPQKGDVFAVQTGEWITSVYALTLATNLSSTSAGAIYSMTITAALISFVVKSNGVYVLLDMISPIISIVFNMLIIRVGLAHDSSFGTSGTNGWGTAMMSDRGSHLRRRLEGTFEMKDLRVEITQVVEEDFQYEREQELDADALGPGTPMDSLPPTDLKGEPLEPKRAESLREPGYSGLCSEKAENEAIV